MRAVVTYIKLIVEYNSVIQSPSSVHDIHEDTVKQVQCHFTKCLPGLRNMSYNELLNISMYPVWN